MVSFVSQKNRKRIVKARGILVAAIAVAALCGCYGRSSEPGSVSGYGGYAARAGSLSEDPSKHYQRGIAELEAGKYDRARRAFDALLEAEPNDAGAHFLAGLARLGDGNAKGALRYFRKAATLNPAMVVAHQRTGVALARLGEAEEAQEVLDQLRTREASCARTCADAADLRTATAAIAAALGKPTDGSARLAPASPPLNAARWLARGNPITVFTREPDSCLAPPKDEEEARAVAIGRSAFRTPALLGGVASRVGLSCAICHTNGRTNPVFSFPGVSGAPGTADVTSEMLSSHRGDGTFNPKPIPDLAAPADKRLVSREPATRVLEKFIYGVIIEEFDGPRPTVRVLQGLNAYVRAISPRACGRERKVSLATHLADATIAIDSAAYAWGEGDPDTARLMVASARTALDLIDERYSPHALAANRHAVRNADLELEAIQNAIDDRRSDIPVRLAAWRVDMTQWSVALKRNETRSLYNPAILTKAVSRNNAVSELTGLKTSD
jgi:hypothetical protein